MNLANVPLLLDSEEASRFLRTTPEVLEALAKSGRVATVMIPGDPDPKFRPEDLARVIDKAAE